MSANAAVVAALAGGAAETYTGLAAAVVILYDHAITLQQEKTVIWERKLTAVTFLFMLNRIFAFCFAVSLAFEAVNIPTQEGCKVTAYFGDIPVFLLYGNWAVFSALRVYVLSNRALTISAFVFVLSIVIIPIKLYTIIKILKAAFEAVFFSPTITVCQATSLPSNAIFTISDVTCQASSMLANTIVLAVTWQRTYRSTKHARAVGVKMHLSNFLLRNGTVYFLIILSLTVMSMGSFLGTRESFNGGDFLTAAEAIIISRFLLDLRSISTTSSDTITQPSSSTLTDFGFVPNFLGNVGAQTHGTFGIDVGQHRMNDDVYDDEDGDVTRSGTSEIGMQVRVVYDAEEGEVVEVSRAQMV